MYRQPDHSEWPSNVLDHGEHKPYGKATYSEIRDHLAELEPFDGSTMRAELEVVTHGLRVDPDNPPKHKWQQLPTDEWHLVYRVYSYNKQIAEVRFPSERDIAEGRDLYREFWEDTNYYSSTTSKHQGKLAWLGRNIPQLAGIDPREV